MNTKLLSVDTPEFATRDVRPTAFERMARKIFMSRLAKIETGQVAVSERGEHTALGRLSDDFPLTAHIEVLDPRFFADVVTGGSIGAGESYIRNYWACDELTELCRILIRNRHVLEEVDSGLALIARPMQKLLHMSRKNTRTGSRRNISAHYDLGNDFYQLWLDPKMMYSAAYYDTPETSLEDAATAKLDRICRRLDLGPNDNVVEIGSGWGGFAVYAAKHYGCHVTTTTISKQQYEFAKQVIQDNGLSDRITLLNEDYRDLTGKYDKLVSIEMIEAVGHEYQATFFEKCSDLLKPDGQMLLQAITIADQRYAQYRNGVDFIKRYIFPGGCLTSVTDMLRTTTRHTDMRVLHIEDIGLHYALTLRHWFERFNERIAEISELGYSDDLIRMWRFYLCYCEAAFLERAIGDVQMLLMKPAARRELTAY